MKGYLIDSAKQALSVVNYHDLGDIRRLIGEYVRVAYLWENGDMLFVDQEGSFKRPQFFFYLDEQPEEAIAGKGLMVGADRQMNDDVVTLNPVIELDDLRKKIRFVIRL